MDLANITSSNTNKINKVNTEMSILQKIESEFKRIVFGVVVALIKDEDTPTIVYLVATFVQFFQLLSFPFHDQINEVWNFPDIADNIELALDYLQLIPYFRSSSFSAYIIVFYVIFAMFGFTILDIFYVSFTMGSKSRPGWPVSLLRMLLRCLTTFLFIPVFSLLTSVLSCVENDKGKLAHFIFTDTQCWTGIYYLHGIIAILTSSVFLFVCGITSLLCFECRPSRQTPGARINSRPIFLLLLYEVVLVLFFNFMNIKDYRLVIILFIIVGSAILFYKFHFNSPFYDEFTRKLWSVLMSVNLWTAIMLGFSKMMENVLFQGSIIAWTIGIPFIILIVISDKEYKVDLLLLNSNKFQTGEEIQEQIRYILKLISMQSSNRNAAILLDGFIEIHKQTCGREDCPLKQSTEKNNRLTKALLSNGDQLNEKHGIVLQLIYQMYLEGVKKFPNNASLHIAFAFFLLDKFRNQQQAMQEFIQAEATKPPIDEQFIIYRCKKFIEEEIAESKNDNQGGLDLISEVNFQNQMRIFQANIEKSALLHMEFWSQLSEENPDLSKLDDIGAKISVSLQGIDEQWSRMQKSSSQNASALRLYGKFLIEITNDKETGEDILEKARNITNMAANKKTVHFLNMVSEGDFSNDSTPIIFISGEEEKFGVITNISLSAASLFGYSKPELINRKVNILMPQPYGRYHDGFIERFLNSNESYLIGKHRDRLIFGRNKAGYVFPSYLSLKALPSIIQGIQFVGIFRVEKVMKQAAYILTETDGTIDGISASAINILKIDTKRVIQKKTNIEDFVPNIIKEKQRIFTQTAMNSKGFGVVTFKFPKDSEYRNEGEDDTCEFNCYHHEILFANGNNHAGYYFRFEATPDKNNVPPLTDKKVKISNFQFRFDKMNPIIIGEYVENFNNTNEINLPQVLEARRFDSNDETQPHTVKFNLENERLDSVGFLPLLSPAQTSIRSANAPLLSPEATNTVDYGQGIKTLRLQDGHIVELDEENSDNEGGLDGESSAAGNTAKEEDSMQIFYEQERHNEEAGDGNEFSSGLMSRKTLKAIMNDRTAPLSLKRLNLAIHVFLLGIIGLSLGDYLATSNVFNSVQNNIDLISLSCQQDAHFMTVLSNMRDLYLTYINVFDSGETETSLREAIDASLKEIATIKQSLESKSSSFPVEHRDPVISLRKQNLDVDLKGLSQATDLLISKAIEVSSFPLSQIQPNNSDYFFITYNLLNDYHVGLTNSTKYYTTDLADTIGDKKILFGILIASGVSLFMMLVALFFVLYNINKARKKILVLFLDIPERNIKRLYTKCENFVSNLQIGEDDEVGSNFEEDEFADKGNSYEEDLQEFIPRKKRRKSKDSEANQTRWYFYFFIVAAAIEAVFIFNFVMADNLLVDIETLIPEFRVTVAAEGVFSFANNVQRQILINRTFPIDNNSSTLIVAAQNIKYIYNLDTRMHQEYSFNIQLHSDDYIATFNNVMMTNPCALLSSVIDVTQCETFAEGAVVQGMAVALTRHFENLRTLLTLIQGFINGKAWSEDLAIKSIVTDPTLNKLLNIMRLPKAKEINTMQKVYIKESFRILRESLLNTMQKDFTQTLSRRLIIFVLFVIALVTVYIILWLPWMSKFSNEIWRTKATLSMIPLSIIAKINNVNDYLRKLWNEKSLNN